MEERGRVWRIQPLLHEVPHCLLECEGMNDPDKRMVLKSFLRQCRGLAYIQEIKQDDIFVEIVGSLWDYLRAVGTVRRNYYCLGKLSENG